MRALSWFSIFLAFWSFSLALLYALYLDPAAYAQYDSASGQLIGDARARLMCQRFHPNLAWRGNNLFMHVWATKLTGGMTNEVHHCVLLEQEWSMPQRTLQSAVVREYGSGQYHSRAQEMALQRFMASRGLNARVLAEWDSSINWSDRLLLLLRGQFRAAFQPAGHGGRLEEFIDGRSLEHDELSGASDANVPMAIAAHLGALHSITQRVIDQANVEATAQGTPTLQIAPTAFLFPHLRKWLKAALAVDFSQSHSPNAKYAAHLSKLGSSLDLSNWAAEVDWLERFSGSFDEEAPFVLSHNDLNQGNILRITQHSSEIPVEGDELPNAAAAAAAATSSSSSTPVVVRFVDYEYGSLNHRGFDLGNHFCEYTLDYSRPEWPLFDRRQNRFPTQEQMLRFLSTYLQGVEGDAKSQVNESKLHAVYLEALTHMMSSHLLWLLWDVAQAGTGASALGYLENHLVRSEEYQEHKKRLQQVMQEEWGNLAGFDIERPGRSFRNSAKEPILSQQMMQKLKQMHLEMRDRPSRALQAIQAQGVTRKSIDLS